MRFTQVKFPSGSSHELTMVKVSIPMFLPRMAPRGMFKHIKTSQSFTKGSLLWNQTQAYHLSHSFSTSITNLLTGQSRYWRAISVVPDVPSISLTLLANPFSSVFIAAIFAIGQLFRSAAASLSRTISPTSLRNFFSPSTAKLIRDVLHSSPTFMTINVWCSKSSRGWHHYFCLQG